MLLCQAARRTCSFCSWPHPIPTDDRIERQGASTVGNYKLIGAHRQVLVPGTPRDSAQRPAF